MTDQKIIDDILKDRVLSWYKVSSIPYHDLTGEDRTIIDRGSRALSVLRERYPNILVREIIEELKP